MSMIFKATYLLCLNRVDPDSALHGDLNSYKEKEGKDHILLNFTYKVQFHLIIIGSGCYGGINIVGLCWWLESIQSCVC